ncbi:MAG: endolytic transglycosylase MltG [Ruminococcaceae bacterium]|nr:endolytic transglycosylase MltG [Oscillospiraceae bacterium]
MSDFNRTNREEDLDESIDFMMKKRKKNTESDASVRRPVQGTAPARPVSERTAQPASGQRITPRGEPSRPANAVPQRNTAARPAPQNAPAARPTAQGTPVGVRPAPRNTPAARPAAAPKAADSVTPAPEAVQKREYVTSGQRIVPRERAPEAGKRPIVIKRTSEEVDNQATRKTDVSQQVEKQSKARRPDNKKSSDTGSHLVRSMVVAVIYLVFVTVIAAVISVFAINVGNDVFAFVKSDEVIEVTIPENATTDDIAEILYQNGVIKYKGIFSLYGSIKEIEENYVAGDYSVSPMMNYKSLFYEFKPKRVSGTSWITIPEGYTVDEIIDLMLSYEIGGTKEDYAKVINEGEFDYWFVEELDANGWSEDRFYRLEGYLFPDTYEFYNASDAYTVINKMLKRFSEVYTEAYKARADEIGFTTDQVVTLASMIEKEAGFSSDFRNVSSVFHNRLNNAGTYPRLESDATVVYAIHHLTGERPTDVTGETISYVSPYNTYQNNGLPPGAIANPGMNALKYALYPADTNYYFFVSSKSGTTLFATNVAGHEANKASIKNEQ